MLNPNEIPSAEENGNEIPLKDHLAATGPADFALEVLESGGTIEEIENPDYPKDPMD